MIRTGHVLFGLAAALVLLATAPAQALQVISYVSGNGSGNTCTFAAPCPSIGAAVSATFSGGEIVCVDSAPLGGATITKSITIDCTGTAASTNSLTIQGSNIDVRIRGLRINAVNGAISSPGIDFIDGRSLTIENCVIENFTSSPPIGIRVQPTSTGSKLLVTDTAVSSNGSGTTGGGIVVVPQSGATAQVVLNRVNVSGNVFGVAADSSGGALGIQVAIVDSVMANNAQDGVIAVTPNSGGAINILVTNSQSASNGFGIRAIGNSAVVRVKNSDITSNGTGISSLSGGSLHSGGGNTVQGNGTNGAFTGTYSLQ